MAKRTREIKVRFNDDEYMKLMDKVQVSGLSREKYIRALTRNHIVKSPPPLSYFELINGCNHIGNNLNQLVKLAYVHSTINKEELTNLLYKLNTTLDKMDQEVRGVET